LYLNVDSVREHVCYGLQQYFAQSLLECRSFELALNTSVDGAIRVQLETQEDTTALRIPSAFKQSQAANAAITLDFTSRLSESNTQETLKWVANWEKDLLSAIDNDSIQNRSGLDSTKRIVKFFSELVKQSVANRKVDCFATMGTMDEQSYLAGAIALTDSAKLARQLTEALEAAKQIGFTFTDLRAKSSTPDSQADFLIDLPKSLAIAGSKGDDNVKLHVRIANQGLWIGIGNESEQLRQQVTSTSTPDNGLSPVTLNCDLDSNDAAVSEDANVLPFNFRKMKLKVQVTDSGRSYDIVFGNLGQSNSSQPSASAQAASN
jgi:hypothetical protein